jgi:hypothetical protein
VARPVAAEPTAVTHAPASGSPVNVRTTPVIVPGVRSARASRAACPARLRASAPTTAAGVRDAGVRAPGGPAAATAAVPPAKTMPTAKTMLADLLGRMARFTMSPIPRADSLCGR